MPHSDPPTPNGPRSGGKRRAEGEPIVIKKYANRRLYNTATSSYVTLEQLAELVREGADFVVYDAKTNEDLTHSVLSQIIFDEESRTSQNLLPLQFLRQLIRLYGDSVQALLPAYLEMSLDSFARQRERLAHDMAGSFTGVEAMSRFQDQVRQNFTMFNKAISTFSPFGGYAAGETPPAPVHAEAEDAGSSEALKSLQAQMEEMKRQIAALAAKS